MSEVEFQPGSSDPSEADLRIMLEEREREKELERSQTSKKFSRILIGLVVALAGAIFFFPAKPVTVAPAPLAKAVIPTPLPTPLNPDPTNSDPAMVEDLKPFTPQPGAQGGNKEDIRFAVELLNFMDAADLKTVIPAKEVEPAKKP